jgi:hypothetical protein
MASDFDFDFDFYFDFDSSFDYGSPHRGENDSLPDRDHCTAPLLPHEGVWGHHEDSHILHRSAATGLVQAGLKHSFYRLLDHGMDFLRDL